MKKILITGAGSYIGVSFENYLKQFEDNYSVDSIDMIGDGWKEESFSGYDAIFHVAGIAHIKETEQNRDLYYKVNRDLAIETAKKAKSEGVKQFKRKTMCRRQTLSTSNGIFAGTNETS